MAAVLSNSPITQVSQTPVQTNLQPNLLTRLLLDLRGKRFSVDRETIMNLPESVLLCLFPNGLVLSRQSATLSDGGDNDDYEELYAVDVRIDYPLYDAIYVKALSVRPRMFLVRVDVLPKRGRRVLWNSQLARIVRGTTTPCGRRLADIRLQSCLVTKSIDDKTSYHRSSRGARILHHSA